MATIKDQQHSTNGVHPSYPSLEGLPLELLSLILQHLESRKELKCLRLTSSKFLDVTTIRLFKRYTLYPHETSFDRLLNLANTVSLSDSIQELYINTAFRGLPRVPPRYLVPPLPHIYSRSGKVSKKERKSRPPDRVAKVTAALRSMYSKTYAGGNTSDELSQMVFLQRIFPKLSNLRKLRIADACAESELPHFYLSQLPDFCTSNTKEYTRLLEDFHDDENVQQSYALGVLAAASGVSSLRYFEMHGLDWEDFLGMPDLFRRPVLYRDTLARFDHLELTTNMGKHHWDGDVMLNIQALLQLSYNLTTLILWFRRADEAKVGGETLYDWAYDEHCKSNFQLDLDYEHFEDKIEIPARLSWSSTLTHLELRGLVCTLSEMQSVLGYCAVSLKVLALSDLILVPLARTGARACLVRLFKWMQQHLQLDELRIGGFFTNGGMQDWVLTSEFDQDYDRDDLRRQLIRFVLRGGTCPLDHVEVPEQNFDLGKMRYRREAPPWLYSEDYAGDDSVVMHYSDHEEPPSDDDEDEDEDEDEDGEDEETGSDTETSDAAEDGEDNEWESTSDDSLD